MAPSRISLRKTKKIDQTAKQQSEILTRSIMDMLNGFSYCRMIYDNGKPRDFVYLMVNKAFEVQTGLKDVIGKKVSEVIPGIQEADPQLFEIYGRVAATGRFEKFETFVQSMQMCFSVSVYCPEPEHFVAIFDVITEKKELELAVITEQKQASIALTESEEKFHQFVDQSSDGITIVDENGCVAEWNPAMEKLTGMTRSKVLGRDLVEIQSQFISSESPKAILEKQKKMIQQTLQTGEGSFLNQILESSYKSADGSVRFVQQLTFPIKTQQGYRLGVLLRDCTEKRQVEEALRDSEIRHRLLFENLTQGVIYYSANGEIISANPAAERILGVSADRIVGETYLHPFWKVYCEDGSEMPVQEHPISIALQTGRQVSSFIIGVYSPRKDKQLWLSISAIPLFMDGQSRPFQVYSIFEDITERKNLQDALRKSEQKFQTVFAALSEGIVMQNQEGEIVLCNSAAEKILGLTQEQMFRRTSVDPRWRSIHSDGSPFLGAEHPAILSLRTGLKYCNIEMGVLKPSGEVTWILINTEPLFTPGETTPYAVVSTLSDFTERQRAENALRDSEINLKTIFNATSDSIYLVAKNETLMALNDVAVQRMEQPMESLLGKKVYDLLPGELVASWRPFIDQAFTNGKPTTFEDQLNGRWMVNHLYPILDSSHQVIRVVIFSRDITEQKLAEQELQMQRDFANQIINLMGQGLTVTDARGRFDFVNPAYAAIVGYPPGDLIGKHPHDLTLVEDYRVLDEHRKQRQSGITMTFETRIQRADGRHIPVLITSVPRKADGDTDNGVIAVITDLSEQKQNESELRSAKDALEKALLREQILSRKDSLTGVYNRRELFAQTEDKIAVATRYNQPLAVLMFDIDHFKQVNDIYGHDIGDLVLNQVVQAASSELRNTDIIGRYGGEEFIIVMPVTTASQAYVLAERIRTGVANLVVSSVRGNVSVTLSIGVVAARQKPQIETVEDLFRRADLMMYRAKNAGRNCTYLIEEI